MTTQKTRVLTRERVQTGPRLTEERSNDVDECVQRMFHGAPISDDSPLEFRGQDHAATKARLDEMEQRALQHMMGTVDVRRKQSIIDQLREL